MTTEVPVQGLGAILKLQTVELGWINLLNQRAPCYHIHQIFTRGGDYPCLEDDNL
jgi:hypothetical protein